MSTHLARQDQEQTTLAVADREQAAGALAHILATGDLAKLSNEQRVAHYLNQCQSLGLNPISRPFDWLVLDGKLVLYPNKSCAEQLRRQHQISVKITRREIVGDMFVCEVEGRRPNGVTDEATKYVPLKNGRGEKLTGNNLANAFAKAETGAKRRLVLSMIGLSSPPDADEMHNARIVVVDGAGNLLPNPTDTQKALAADPRMARAIGEPIYEDMGASGAPLAGQPDQGVTDAEITPPERPVGPRPSFKNSDEDIQRWRGAWFATVKGLSLDSDQARAAYVAAWTADEWPKAKRTDSLTTMLKRATPAEAQEFLAHVRALMEDERRELLQFASEQPSAESQVPDKVRDSVALTGGPAF